MAKTRVKPMNLVPIADLGQADAALREIAELKRRLGAREAQLNEAIDQLKAEAAAAAAPDQARLKSLEGGLQAFSEYNRDTLFPQKKSVELNHGLLGYRKTTALKTAGKTTWAMVLAKLKELEFFGGIRAKEEVNKEELLTWPSERLDLVGARRESQDVFWYEVKEEEIAAA